MVLIVSASVQTIYGWKINRTTRAYSASALEEWNNAIEAFIDFLYNKCSTDFQNDDFCTAAKRIVSVGEDHLHSLEACQIVPEDKTLKTMSGMNMEQMML